MGSTERCLDDGSQRLLTKFIQVYPQLYKWLPARAAQGVETTHDAYAEGVMLADESIAEEPSTRGNVGLWLPSLVCPCPPLPESNSDERAAGSSAGGRRCARAAVLTRVAGLPRPSGVRIHTIHQGRAADKSQKRAAAGQVHASAGILF
jgi:hypothetical protein